MPRQSTTAPGALPAPGGSGDRQAPEPARAAEQRGATRKRPRALTRTPACGELRRELGVYVLGAIAPADRGAVESHLAACSSCRDLLADLACLPALLRRVPPDELDGVFSAGEAGDRSMLPDKPLGSLLSEAARRRRYRRRWQLAATAAAGLAVGAAAAYGALGRPARQPTSLALPGAITVRGSNPRTDARAVVTYAGRPWGVQLYVQVTGIAAGTRCVIEVTGPGGQESVAGSWTVAGRDERAWYAASSSVAVAAVRGFVVTAGTRPLVRIGVPVAPTRAAGQG